MAQIVERLIGVFKGVGNGVGRNRRFGGTGEKPSPSARVRLATETTRRSSQRIE